MRILFSHHIFTLQATGGISRYFTELIHHLLFIPGVTARIVAPLFRNHYLAQSRPAGLVGVSVPEIQKTGRALSTLNGVVERGWSLMERPAITHATYFSLPSHRPGIPTVITVYDMIHELFPGDGPTVAAQSAAKRRAVERADHIICISETTRRDLILLLGTDERRISVVHLGTSLGRNDTRSTSSSDDPYVLFVGRRDGYKNFTRLLEAFSHSRAAQDHRLVCFGGGALTPDERQDIARLHLDPSKVVNVSGPDSLLAHYYQNASALVVPSLYEGFGLPALEAMALGCPVVCSTGGSLPEVVGDAALLFDPTDVEGMVAALDSVVGDRTLAATLSKHGRERAQRFSWADCAEKTLAVYRSLVD